MLRDHMRVDDDQTDDDALIEWLERVAVEKLEDLTNRAINNQTWDFTFERFPLGGAALYLPRSPLRSVTSITYLDVEGVQQTFPASDYRVDIGREPGMIYLDTNKSWPTTESNRNTVTVRAVVGYETPTDVPKRLGQAIKFLVAYYYEHRESNQLIIGGGVLDLPKTFDFLIEDLRVRRF